MRPHATRVKNVLVGLLSLSHCKGRDTKKPDEGKPHRVGVLREFGGSFALFGGFGGSFQSPGGSLVGVWWEFLLLW